MNNLQPFPSNIEAEKSILRAVIIYPEDLAAVAVLLKPGHFYTKAHRLIFQSCLELANAGDPIDLVTLKADLEARGKLDTVGGAVYLAALLDFPPPADLNHYSQILIEKWTRRRLIEAGNAIIKTAFRTTTDIDPLHQAQALIESIDPAVGQAGFDSAANIANEALDRYETAASSGDMPGVPSGFYDLDKLTAGFQPGDLIVLGARPAMGKTAFAVSVARNAATIGFPVGFFSLEMSKTQLFDRLIATESGVNSLKFRTGSFAKSDWEKVTTAVGLTAEKPIFIDDTPGLSHRELSARVRQMTRRANVNLIFVDYLQLLAGDRGQGRVEEVSSISRALKSIARQNDVAVVALSQLSRALESRDKKRPRLSDLRDSGAIEQDADVVLFLYRDEVYNPQTEKPCIAEIEIAKHRTGPTGLIELRWNRFTTAFQPLERRNSHGNYEN